MTADQAILFALIALIFAFIAHRRGANPDTFLMGVAVASGKIAIRAYT